MCRNHPHIQAVNFAIRDLERTKVDQTKLADVSGDYAVCPTCMMQPEIRVFNNTIRDLEREIAGVTKNVEFYKDHTSCPTCKQAISDELRQEHINETNKTVDQNNQLLISTQAQKEEFGATGHLKHVTEAKDSLTLTLRTLDFSNRDWRTMLVSLHATHMAEVDSKMLGANVAIHNIVEVLDKKKVEVGEIEVKEREIAVVDKNISTINSEISGIKRFLTSLETERGLLNQKSGNIEQEKAKLREMAKEVLTMTGRKAILKEEKDYHDVATVLLKDGGVKTRIIKQYLPAINKMVNKYLHAMDFFASFELNEQVKITLYLLQIRVSLKQKV